MTNVLLTAKTPELLRTTWYLDVAFVGDVSWLSVSLLVQDQKMIYHFGELGWD
jgi:hypothetical protein